MKRQGGFRRGTRSKLKKSHRDKGKISQRNFFQKLELGDRVKLTAEPAYHGGMYFPRFHGRVCVVCEKKGDCYCVNFKDKDKEKTLIVHPVHLTKVE